mmetsp:Transcript_35141/g.62642  ORF Transcript_35141/g.62642 Transcript_35141/m.62642 type:complete len:203 (+) Transcript_35141:428-1036(+)
MALGASVGSERPLQIPCDIPWAKLPWRGLELRRVGCQSGGAGGVGAAREGAAVYEESCEATRGGPALVAAVREALPAVGGGPRRDHQLRAPRTRLHRHPPWTEADRACGDGAGVRAEGAEVRGRLEQRSGRAAGGCGPRPAGLPHPVSAGPPQGHQLRPARGGGPHCQAGVGGGGRHVWADLDAAGGGACVAERNKQGGSGS